MARAVCPSCRAYEAHSLQPPGSIQPGGLDMLKFIGGTVGIIFLVGLAVVIGILALIF